MTFEPIGQARGKGGGSLLTVTVFNDLRSSEGLQSGPTTDRDSHPTDGRRDVAFETSPEALLDEVTLSDARLSRAYNSSVTKLLEKALAAVSDLPPAEQDELAARLLDEVAWERGAGREKLRWLVDEAREDIRAGRVRELRPDDV